MRLVRPHREEVVCGYYACSAEFVKVEDGKKFIYELDPQLVHTYNRYVGIFNCIELAFSLLGVFAALLWLKPGRRHAARYAMIVLPFSGLCFILYQNPGEYGRFVLAHLAAIMPLITFLLGKYMLRCPWREVFLSLGVYAIISQLTSFAYMAHNMQAPESGWPELVFPLSFYIEVLWAWSFILLFTRKDDSIRPVARIYTAAALLIIHKSIIVCFMAFGGDSMRYLQKSAADAGSVVPGLLSGCALILLLVLTLCYAASLRYVLLQSWKRSIGAVVVAMLALSIVAGIYYHVLHVRVSEQLNLTENLLTAIEEANPHAVERCLQQGVDVNMPQIAHSDQNGELSVFYPLIHATARNQIAIVRSLLAAGAHVEVKRNNGDTALISACIENNPEMIQLLLQAGADVNTRNDDGYTPLIQSAMSGPSVPSITALLQAGANTNDSDNEGSTALHYATLPEEEERPAALATMRLLLENGAQTNIQDIEGDTPLLHCARDGFTEGVRLLLEYQANPALSDKKGMTPLQYAEQNGHTEIVELLRASQPGS